MTWVVLVAVLALTVVACSDGSRPSVAQWSETWAQARSYISDIDDLRGPDGEERCADGLAALRRMRGDLVPTPDAVLDQVVTTWANEAEGALFECPPTHDPTFVETFETLQRLEAEVAAVLDIDTAD